MIAFKYVERATIDLNVCQGRWNKDVRIGITIAVSVCGKIVGQEKSAERNELRNWFSMITGDARSEVLRCLDSARCGLNGISRNGYGSSRTAGICIDEVLLHKDLFSWIRRKQIDVIHIGGDGDPFNRADGEAEVDLVPLYDCADYQPS